MAAARGRFARNAVVQGAAAELFKAWAVTVRARLDRFGARIVLCLHDELLVHCPISQGSDVAGLLDDCLVDAARRWTAGGRGAGGQGTGGQPGGPVRFVVDVGIVGRWSDSAKA